MTLEGFSCVYWPLNSFPCDLLIRSFSVSDVLFALGFWRCFAHRRFQVSLSSHLLTPFGDIARKPLLFHIVRFSVVAQSDPATRLRSGPTCHRHSDVKGSYCLVGLSWTPALQPWAGWSWRSEELGQDRVCPTHHVWRAWPRQGLPHPS